MPTLKDSKERDVKSIEVPQDNVGTIILMFAWITLVIYGIGRQFIPEGGTAPTWLLLLVTVLGTGAELVTGFWQPFPFPS